MVYTLTPIEEQLINAQIKAEHLFDEVQKRQLIQVGVTERALSDEIFWLAQELFGIKKYWHKRIVRTGVNTVCPYRENPPNLAIQENDLVFFDFGPVFEEYEADFGRTYLLGNDLHKRKMVDDLAVIFYECKQFFKDNPRTTGKQLYEEMLSCCARHGWKYSKQDHCGHLIGQFPHEKIAGDEQENYICSGNNKSMNDLDQFGNKRHWILEVHLIDEQNQYGAFYEELLTLDPKPCAA